MNKQGMCMANAGWYNKSRVYSQPVDSSVDSQMSISNLPHDVDRHVD